MSAFLKRMRWAALLTCYLVIVRVCGLFHIGLPMDSFWRPHNLRRFRPYYVALAVRVISESHHNLDECNGLLTTIDSQLSVCPLLILGIMLPLSCPS